MYFALSVILAALPLLATAAPLPESGPNRTLIIRNPTGGVDHFVYSHTVRDHILPRDDTHSAEVSSPHLEDGYDAGKTGVDGVDHPLSSTLSSPDIPTTASYPAKTVLDTSAHRIDGEVLSDSPDKDEPKGVAEGMDQQREGGAKVEVSHEGMKRRDEGMGEQGGDGGEEMEMMREVGEQEEQGMGQGEEGMERRE